MIRRRQRLIAVSLSFLVLAACANAGVGIEQRNAIDSTLSLRAAGANLAFAADTVTSANQQRADAHLQLALAYYQQNQWQVALDEVALVLQVMPQQSDALSMRGLIYMASERQALAGAEFLQALQIAPDQPDYLNNYAWFLCQTGHAKASLNWFERAAKQPDYRTPEKALNNAGACSLLAGDQEMAKDYFLRAAAMQSGDVRSNTELAKIYFNDGNYSRARLHAERATAVAKPGVDALWLAIKLAHKSDQPSRETKWLTQLRNLYPDSAEYAAYQRGVFDE